MGCRRVASLHLAPLIARLMLAVCFIPCGWNLVMEQATLEGSPAAEMRALLERPLLETPTEASETDAAPATDDEAMPIADDSPIEVRRVLLLAATLHREGMPMPVLLAWAAAVTELVGGGLLVIGLLTRFWALGMTAIAGVAFATTGLEGMLADDPLVAWNDPGTTIAPLAIGGLALVLLLSGPGAVSMDHGIFGGGLRDRPGRDRDRPLPRGDARDSAEET